MRYDKNVNTFIEHFDWYTKDETDRFYIPTAKAPKEAVEAMKKVNEHKKWEENKGINM